MGPTGELTAGHLPGQEGLYVYDVAMARPGNILLDTCLRAAAKRLAAGRELSVSAYIRGLIRAGTGARASVCDISPLVGILGTGAGPTDIARDKHIMVRQAFGERELQ